MGSLTGAVASKRVTEALKGQLSADGNRAMSVNAEADASVSLSPTYPVHNVPEFNIKLQ